jgi:hypothetical protein
MGSGALLIVLLAAWPTAQLLRVHAYGWEWTLSPSEAPPKVHFMDRDYGRGAEEPLVPDGWVQRGETLGGGDIFAPAGDKFPVVLIARSDDGAWGYGLIGGP